MFVEELQDNWTEKLHILRNIEGRQAAPAAREWQITSSDDLQLETFPSSVPEGNKYLVVKNYLVAQAYIVLKLEDKRVECSKI